MMMMMIDEGPPPKQDATEVSKLYCLFVYLFVDDDDDNYDDWCWPTFQAGCRRGLQTQRFSLYDLQYNVSQCITTFQNKCWQKKMYHNVSRCENVRCFLSDGDQMTEDPFPPLFNRYVTIICVAQPNPPTEIPVGQRGKVSPPHFYNPGPPFPNRNRHLTSLRYNSFPPCYAFWQMLTFSLSKSKCDNGFADIFQVFMLTKFGW